MESKSKSPSVEEISKSMQHFNVYDYTVFLTMLVSCGFIGLYHSLRKKRDCGENEYLVGGRNMQVFPISMSLIASYISGISLLGTPTEIYVHGISYMCIIMSKFLVGVLVSKIYLPVFHEMQLTSTYEYLEKRFDKSIRIFGSSLFSIGIITWLPIVIYVPALAFNQVTGINVHAVTPFVCLVCIFYTCVGGLRAVVWTDFIQAFIMFATMLLVVIKGTIDLGGFSVVMKRNYDSGRLEMPSSDLNLLERYTFWSLIIGGTVHSLQTCAINQNMIQRYLSLPSLDAAKKALWIFIIGLSILIGVCGYAGMITYAWYHECDPLTTKNIGTQILQLAKHKDQLLPLLVMNILGDFPGLPGLFVAAVFSAALSSLSTGLNSMAAVVFEDFIKPFRRIPFTPKNAENVMKFIVVFVGLLCVALVFVVEKAGSHVLQLSMSLSAITSGPSLGIFTIGLLIPWINAKGALIGGISGLSLMGWFCISAESAITGGKMRIDTKPVSTQSCTYSFKNPNSYFDSMPQDMNSIDDESLTPELWPLLRLSYLWYTMTGVLITVSVGLLVSIFSSADPKLHDPILFAPFIRKYVGANFKSTNVENIADDHQIEIMQNTKVDRKTST